MNIMLKPNAATLVKIKNVLETSYKFRVRNILIGDKKNLEVELMD